MAVKGSTLRHRGGTLHRLRHRPFFTLRQDQQQQQLRRGDGDVGVFGVVGLHEVKDWKRLTQEAVAKCDALRARLRGAGCGRDEISGGGSDSGGPLSSMDASEQLLMLDGISNAVCSVIDAAELCRNVHCEAAWRDAAEASFAALSGYIAELNTDTSLYAVLADITAGDDTDGGDSIGRGSGSGGGGAASRGGALESLSKEEQRFAWLLRAEFERDGIQLPDDERANLRALNEAVVALETHFTRNVGLYYHASPLPPH